MARDKLSNVPDSLVLPLVEFLLRGHSKEGRARVVNMIFTGSRLQDLRDLQGFTTQPHYGINGLVETSLGARDQILCLLSARYPRVFLSLEYSWGQFPISLSSEAVSGEVVLSIDLESPAQGWLLQGLIAGLVPILGVERLARGPIPGGGMLDVTDFGSVSRREGIRLSLPSFQDARLNEFIKELVENLALPSKVHVNLTGEFAAIRELQESGKIISCVNCCPWHFEYMSLLSEESNVDVASLPDVVSFLARRVGRERSLLFRGFTWRWESGLDPSTVNSIIWSVPKRGQGSIKISWSDDDPPPRGTAGLLRKELAVYVERHGRHGGGSGQRQ